MKNIYKIIGIAFTALVLTACQPVVRTQIQTFHSESETLAAGNVFIAPAGGEDMDTLEFQYYRNILATKLAQIGLQSSSKAEATYLATLGFAVSRQEKDKPSSRVFVSGFWGRYPHSGVVLSDDLGPDFEYVREISLTIDKKAPPAAEKSQLLQVRASSEGACQHVSVVFDEMLDAIFQDLWRANGSVVSVKVKGEASCP